MKRMTIFATVLLVIAGASYWAVREYGLTRPLDQWGWMQREFHLSHPQLLRIQTLNAAYQPVCVDHCNRLLKVRRELTALQKAGRRNTPDYVQTLIEWEGVKRNCEEGTFKHIQAVAAVMDPKDGRRYLAITVPRVVRAAGREPFCAR